MRLLLTHIICLLVGQSLTLGFGLLVERYLKRPSGMGRRYRIPSGNFLQPPRSGDRFCHCAAPLPARAWPVLGTAGINMRLNVGITSRLQNGESNIPPTITQANGC